MIEGGQIVVECNEKMYLHYLEKSSLIYELIVYLLKLCVLYYALLVKIIQSIDEKMN
jgi:hypothetical protein